MSDEITAEITIVEHAEPARTSNPYKLTPEITHNIAELIRGGAYAHVAAGACGIARSTYHHWMSATSTPGEPYDTFRAAINQAKDEARARAEILVRMDKPDVWLMRGPGRHGTVKDGPGWSTKDEVQITGKDGGPLQIQGDHIVEHVGDGAPAQGPPRLDLTKLTDVELNALRAILTKCLPGGDPSDS